MSSRNALQGLAVFAFWAFVVVSGCFAADPAIPAAAPARASLGKATAEWEHAAVLFRINEGLVGHAPKDQAGELAERNPGLPFTYEEQVYDKPSRDWWWGAARYTVIFAGGAILTYFSAGLLAPWVGGAIGGLSGLSGAAAVSQGLALLGGGAVAAGGFGMAGGTIVVGVVTDLAISTALEYSLRPIDEEKRFAGLNEAIRLLDNHQTEPAAWSALEAEVSAAASVEADYVMVVHAVAAACMRWAADENISRAIRGGDEKAEERTAVSDRQRTLMAVAIRLLEEARRLEPQSSLVHHSLGNAYWWLSVRGCDGLSEDAAYALPASAKLAVGPQDEVACFQAAIWHYSAGAAAEPRNFNIRNNWATALQSDGTLHEAIAVVAGGLPYIADCQASDQAALLRTIAMLQYQAFTRTPLSERSESEGGFPRLDESPMLMASMQAYSKAVDLDPRDLSSLASLLHIYNQAPPGRLLPPTSVLSLADVQFRLIELVLSQEKAFAEAPVDRRPKEYRPGQLMTHYRELLRSCFAGLVADGLEGKRLAKMQTAIDGWLAFVEANVVLNRPFTRDVVVHVHQACKRYNDSHTLSSVNGYSLKRLDSELSSAAEDP